MRLHSAWFAMSMSIRLCSRSFPRLMPLASLHAGCQLAMTSTPVLWQPTGSLPKRVENKSEREPPQCCVEKHHGRAVPANPGGLSGGNLRPEKFGTGDPRWGELTVRRV